MIDSRNKGKLVKTNYFAIEEYILNNRLPKVKIASCECDTYHSSQVDGIINDFFPWLKRHNPKQYIFNDNEFGEFIDYCINNNIKVITNSHVTGMNEYKISCIKKALEHGIIIVSGASNDMKEIKYDERIMAGIRGVITGNSLDMKDSIMPFGYGEIIDCNQYAGWYVEVDGQVGGFVGQSSTAPFVAGMIATCIAINQNINQSNIQEFLDLACVPNGDRLYYGRGFLKFPDMEVIKEFKKNVGGTNGRMRKHLRARVFAFLLTIFKIKKSKRTQK